MTTRHRNSLLWLATIGTCLFGYLLLAPEPTPKRPETIGTTLGIEPADVRALTISGDGSSSSLSRKDGVWAAHGPETAQTDAADIGSWLSTTLHMPVVGPMNVEGVKFERHLQIEVTSGGIHTVGIGREVPTGEGAYIEVGGLTYIASNSPLTNNAPQTNSTEHNGVPHKH